MEETAQRIAELIKKHIDELLTEEEARELETWASQSDENRTKFAELTERKSVATKLEQFEQYDKEKSWGKLKSQYLYEETPIVPIRRKRFWIRWVAAASVIFITVLSFWLVPRFARDDKGEVATQEERFKNDVDAPGSNKATLTLDNGRIIVLESAGNGQLASEGNASVVKNGDQIEYKVPRDARDDKKEQYNTLTIPKGSRPVQLKLADGTEVWMDASSSITYPTAFVGTDRTVEMNGQAYFEVAPAFAKAIAGERGGKRQFIVKSGDVSVTVLGTHFNVNAFQEDEIKVTLLEGSVKVSRFARDDKAVIIKPGQQAQIPRDARDDKGITVAGSVDIDEVMAWKNGLFRFKEENIETIMKQLERWYDVEVVYEGKVTDHFITTVPRSQPISQVLKYLETTGRVKFKIDGRKVTVLK